MLNKALIASMHILLLSPASQAGASPSFGAFSLEEIRLRDDQNSYKYEDGRVSGPGGEVSEGRAERVRRVALFRHSVELAPFFFSPYLEDDFSGAVARLDAEEKGLVKTFSLNTRLYPVDFLKAYARSSNLFRIFSSSPTEETAAALLGSITRGVAAYGKGADEYYLGLNKYLPSDVERINFLGGESYTLRETFIRDARLIKKNAVEARRRLATLKKCLSVSSSYCAPAWAPGLWEGAAGTAPDPARIIPPEELGISSGAYRGPYLVDSSCWEGTDKAYLYYTERPGPGGLLLEWDTLATDFLFTVIFHKNLKAPLLAAKGLDFMPVGPTSAYDCNDLSYKPALQELDYFFTRYSSAPLSPLIMPSGAPISEEVNRAERKFFAAEIPEQDSLERLARIYFRVYLEKSRLAPVPRGAFLERAQRVFIKTDGLGRVLNRLTYHLAHFRKVRGGGNPQAPLLSGSLFLSRNHHSLLFMPFSSSVWMVKEKPRFIDGHELDSSQGKLLHYNEAVEKYGLPKVVESLKIRVGPLD